MMWGCISSEGLGNLLTRILMKEIPENTVKELAIKIVPNGNFIIQQDDTSCYTVRSTKTWFIKII